MIRVNLLPVKRKKKAKALPSFIISMVLLIVVSAIASAYTLWYLNSRISSLTKQKQENEALIADLSGKIKEVQNFQTQKKTLEERRDIIEKLRKHQSIPVKILAEISNVLPNNVWLTSMSVAGDNISLAGSGFTNEDVVNYVDSLKISQLFTDVYLQGSQRASVGNVITYQFTLTCKVKAS